MLVESSHRGKKNCRKVNNWQISPPRDVSALRCCIYLYQGCTTPPCEKQALPRPAPKILKKPAETVDFTDYIIPIHLGLEWGNERKAFICLFFLQLVQRDLLKVRECSVSCLHLQNASYNFNCVVCLIVV